MGDAPGLGQDREQGVVGRPAMLLRVVPLQRPLLASVPLEDAGVEVEGGACRSGGEPIQAPGSERLEGGRDRLRREAAEEAGDRCCAREPTEAEELADRDIGLEHREDDVMRRGGVGRGADEREYLRELRAEADPLGEGHEQRQATKGRHRLVAEGDSDCLAAIQRAG